MNNTDIISKTIAFVKDKLIMLRVVMTGFI
jgi:hypothetical protein